MATQLTRAAIEVGHDYEIVEICPLYDSEDARSDEMCVIGEGKTVQIVAKGNARLKVRYGKYTGWIEYETSDGRNFILRKKKQQKGLFSSLFGNKLKKTGSTEAIQIAETDWGDEEERCLCIEDGVYHSLGVCTLRTQEDLFSNEVVDIQAHTRVKILQIGKSRRAQVLVMDGECEGTVGWLSLRTSFMEMLVGPLKVQCFPGPSRVSQRPTECWMFWNLPRSVIAGKQSVYQEYEIGATLEAHVGATLYHAESLSSSAVGVIAPGSYVRILSIGINHPFRCKVVSWMKGQSEIQIGWVDGKTRGLDDVLGVAVTKGAPPKASSPLKEIFQATRNGAIEKLRETIVGLRNEETKKSGKSVGFLQGNNSANFKIDGIDSRGRTLVTHAAACGRVSVLEFLLGISKELNVDQTDDTGKTALHWSCKRMCLHSSYESIHKTAELTHDNEPLSSPRVVKHTKAFAEASALLLKAQASVDIQDIFGNTPLMYATMRNDRDQMQLLLQAGCKVDKRNFEGYSAFDLANMFNKKPIAALLTDFGSECQWVVSEPLRVVFARQQSKKRKCDRKDDHDKASTQKSPTTAPTSPAGNRKTTTIPEDEVVANATVDGEVNVNEINLDFGKRTTKSRPSSGGRPSSAGRKPRKSAKVSESSTDWPLEDTDNTTDTATGSTATSSVIGTRATGIRSKVSKIVNDSSHISSSTITSSHLTKSKKKKKRGTKKLVNRPDAGGSDWPDAAWPEGDGDSQGEWPTGGDGQWPADGDGSEKSPADTKKDVGMQEEEWPEADEEWPQE